MPTDNQVRAVLFEIGAAKTLAIVIVFDRAGSDFTVTRNGNHLGAPNYTVSHSCGTGSGTPTIVSRTRDVTTDLGAGTIVYLNQSLSVVLEQVPDNWVKCTA